MRAVAELTDCHLSLPGWSGEERHRGCAGQGREAVPKSTPGAWGSLLGSVRPAHQVGRGTGGWKVGVGRYGGIMVGRHNHLGCFGCVRLAGMGQVGVKKEVAAKVWHPLLSLIQEGSMRPILVRSHPLFSPKPGHQCCGVRYGRVIDTPI